MTTGRPTAGRRIALALLASFALAGAANAKGPQTKIDNIESGQVCFRKSGAPETCVAIDSAHGNLFSGDRRVTSEWVVGVRDAAGKSIDKVKLGGDIVVFSPQAYARRDSQSAPYTIHRLDVKAKPVKTPYLAIRARTRRIGWDNWAGEGGAAAGMTALPTQESMTDGMIPVGGVFGGVSASGDLSPTIPDVRMIYEYGDYRVIAHADNKTYSIADADFRLLSPKLDNVVSFRTDYDQYAAMMAATSKMVFAIPVTSDQTGSRTLYNLLPFERGQTTPPGLIGLAPLLDGGGQSCGAKFDANCRQLLQGWIGVWAGEAGPVVSLEGPLMTQVSVERFKTVEWEDLTLSAVAIVEPPQGGFALRAYKPGRGGDFAIAALPDAFADRASAKAAVQRIRYDEIRRINDAYEASKAVERARYAAWQAAQAQEQASRAERARAEDAENRQADALIASKDADKICAASWTMSTFYARTNLFDACRTLRPPPEQKSRGFWGDLNAGLAAYNRAVASGQLPAPASSGSYAPAGVTPDNGDFARSMRSIDNALRVIGDPNWNGAAGAAQR